MTVERGDSDAPVGGSASTVDGITIGGTATDIPGTFEQSSLKGTTTTGNARLVVRDATQIDVIDTGAYFTSNTVEGALEELADAFLTSSIEISDIQIQLSNHEAELTSLDLRVSQNENDIANIEIGVSNWGTIIGTLSDQTDLQAALDLKATEADLTTAEGRITVNEGGIASNLAAILSNDSDIAALDGRLTTAEGDITQLESDRVLRAGDTMTGKLLAEGNIDLGVDTVTPGAIKFFNSSVESNDPTIKAVSLRSAGVTNDLEIKANSTGGALYLGGKEHFFTNTSLGTVARLDDTGNLQLLISAPTDASHATRKDYVDGEIAALSGVYEPADATILKDADIGVTVQPYDATTVLDADVTYELLDTNGDVGTSAGQLAIGNHNHDTDYLNLVAIGSVHDPDTETEGYFLSNHANSPDPAYYWHITNKFYGSIGSNRAQSAIQYNTSDGECELYVRSYYSATGWTNWTRADNADNVISSDITYETLDANGDVGTLAGQLAIGNHTHSGVYEPVDATILRDADIGVTVHPYDATVLVDADIGVNVEAYAAKNTAWNKNFGTTAGTVSEGNHNHSGVYEPADATILKDADIGVTVQAYSALNAYTNDITYETLDANGDVGTGAGQLAIGNHNHSGVYLPIAGKAADSDKLDNLDSTQFLRSDAIDYSDQLLYLRQPTVWANGVPTKNLGTPSITEMALFDEQFNNKTAFYDWTELTFEYTTDGTTWLTDTSVTQSQIEKLLGGDASSNINITNTTWVGYRITIHNDGNYVYLNALYIYSNPAGNTSQIQTEVKNNVGAWESLTSSTSSVGGWPAHWYMPIPTVPFKDPATAGSHKTDIRFTFTPTWINANNIQLYKLQVWGGYPAGKRNIYGTDQYQNVTFPAALGASTLKVGGTDIATLYEPKDATILKDADIGVTVQAYNLNNALKSDITYGQLDTNGDVGTGVGQLAIGNHNHSGVYEPADATILKDADIGVTVQAYNANYVVDAAYVHTDNNFTTPLKLLYDSAYTHSVSAHAPTNADNTAANETSHADVVVDGDFLTAGFMKTNGAGVYSVDGSTYSLSTHNHSGVYEPADATILKDADIGVTVQAYNAANALTSDVTYETLDANGDVGASAGQLAIGNHNHSGVYQETLNVTGCAAPTASNLVLTSVGTTGCSWQAAGSAGGFPAGTLMLFQQTAAPTGWTKQTTHNNKALRVVSGTVGSGGATAFTTVFGSSKNTSGHTLTSSQVPNHSHSASAASNGNHRHSTNAGGGSSTTSHYAFWSAYNTDTGYNNTNYAGSHSHTITVNSTTGGGGSHSHGLSLNLQYVDLIIASKDA